MTLLHRQGPDSSETALIKEQTPVITNCDKCYGGEVRLKKAIKDKTFSDRQGKYAEEEGEGPQRRLPEPSIMEHTHFHSRPVRQMGLPTCSRTPSLEGCSHLHPPAGSAT